jgi:hypothetical protein
VGGGGPPSNPQSLGPRQGEPGLRLKLAFAGLVTGVGCSWDNGNCSCGLDDMLFCCVTAKNFDARSGV